MAYIANSPSRCKSKAASSFRAKHPISEQFRDPAFLARRRATILKIIAEETNCWNRIAKQCLDAGRRLSEAEINFLMQIKRATYEPSVKQRAWLTRIAMRCGVEWRGL